MPKGALQRYAFFLLQIPLRLDLLLFTAFLLASPSRSLALDPNRALTQYGHDVWTDQNGLPQNSIQAVAQTRDGYIWMGTQEGLVRFDGLRFEVFDRRNTPAMATNNVLALLEDHEDGLWAGLEIGGALRFKDGSITAVGTAQGLPSDKVICLLEDRDHRVWLGTDGGGLGVWRDGVVVAYGPKDGLADPVVNCLLESRKGSLWVGTNRGLFQMRDGAFHKVDLGSAERNWFYALAEDGDETIWVGSLKGLFQIRTGGAVTRYGQADGLCSNNVLCLHADPASRTLWVGTLDGLNRYRDGRIETFTTREGLSNGSVESLCSDAEGNLWIGTMGGLNRFRDAKFYSITTREGLSGSTVLSVCESQDRSLWVACEGGGVTRLLDGIATRFSKKEGLPAGAVNALCPDGGEALWAGVDVGGLARFDGSRFVPLATRDAGLLNTTITCIVKTADGALWAGAGNGLYRIAGGAVTRFGSKEGLTGRSVNCLLELSDGRLAVGTDGGGLDLFREGVFTVLTPKDGLGSLMIYALYEDPQKTLWIGTGDGLSILRGGRLTKVTSRQGLFDDSAYVVLEDHQGFLWMSCNKGVYRARKSDLLAVTDGKSPSVPCWSYGRSDGMGSSECNGGVQPSGWKMTDGRLCFATMKGVAIIAPAAIRLNDRPPPVVIEEVLLDGRDATRFGHRFPPGKHRLEVRFSALSLVAPDKVRFKYRLEGFDPDWVDGGGKREAVYTGLPPGPYQFRVIACNNDGVWNETGATYPFAQAPRFYQTGVFLILCILTGLLMVGGVVALRVGALKRRQVILERLVEKRTVEVAQANHSLREQSTALQEANLKLERLSKEDGLTGIANRRHFEEVLDMEWRRGTRTSTPLSIVMIDIDEFKTYNDALGHQQGDECLRRVAGALAGILNRAGDLVARYGGDEFVAVLPSVDAGHALALAERLRQTAEDLDLGHERSHGLRQVTTISVGVATAILTEGGSAEALLAEADRALYRAKDNGRNRVCSA